MLHQTTLKGCALASAAGFGINIVVAMFGKANPKHPLLLTFSGTKTPVWCWLLSAMLSGTIYTTLYGVAMYHSEFRNEWLLGSDARPLSSTGNDLFYLRCFLYTFFGYLARDFAFCYDNPLFAAHHVACMAGILSTLETTSPGAIAGVHGMLVLEFGSFFFNLWSVDTLMCYFPTHFRCWPRCQFFSMLYYVMLTISNIIAGYFLYHSVRSSFKENYVVYGWWACISGVILLYLRQIEVNKSMKGINKKPYYPVVETEQKKQ